ncbi:MAG: DUF3866 family protein [Actinomycetota bacterium]|nr:DUF3866 family protein [Actinomycetota bacterium]
MAFFREGIVRHVVEEMPDLVRAEVELDTGESCAADAFPPMIGRLEAGHRVVVNTTGLDLGLGTGGRGFVLWDLDAPPPAPSGGGHIVKMRYTPWQTEVLAVEEEASEHYEALVDAESIGGMPVVACGLHSHVPAVAAGVRAERPDAGIGYLMTDGAGLPLAWSDLVRASKGVGLLDVTATCGHAFGGDLETINVFSGLVALRHAARADVAIVAMGPGVVGTGSALGFTAIEQGQVLDAATALGGRAVACLRISFADERPRHHGISHHTLTALRLAAREPADVVVPQLPATEELLAQLGDAGRRHRVHVVDPAPGMELLRATGLRLSSMRRSIDEVPETFAAAAAAGTHAGRLLEGPPRRAAGNGSDTLG